MCARIRPLKNRMPTSNAAFDNANYGAKTFTAFLELPAVAKKVQVRRLDSGQTQARRI